MLYHLLAPLAHDYLIFNLFNYISFRAAGAMLTALLLAFVAGPSIIARLKARKIGQVIRSEGLASHQGKRGTPTMGGMIILLATVIPTLLWAPLTNRFVIVALLAMLWTGAIGFVDDYLKIVEGKSRGLVAKWKLVASRWDSTFTASRWCRPRPFPPRRPRCPSSSTPSSSSLPGSTWRS
jgi:phospho-N-acetylmuramoyl-pentapeptide-transferase